MDWLKAQDWGADFFATVHGAGPNGKRSRHLAERYELKSQAGSGGMGTVFQALDQDTRAQVAVKILNGKNASDAARFDQEADLLAELRGQQKTRKPMLCCKLRQ